MSEEVLALVIILSGLTFVFSLVRSIQKFILKRNEQESLRESGDSLTASELHQMIRDAVAEVNAPMAEKLESVSRRLEEIEGGVGRIVAEDESELQEKTLGRPERQRQR